MSEDQLSELRNGIKPANASPVPVQPQSLPPSGVQPLTERALREFDIKQQRHDGATAKAMPKEEPAPSHASEVKQPVPPSVYPTNEN